MLLGFILLFFWCDSSVKSQTWNTTTPEDTLSPLQLLATPDYPVAAGQTVTLSCGALSMPADVTCAWQRLQQNHTWREVGIGGELTLTEPEESGVYRCHAGNWSSGRNVSHGHAVYIVSMQATVGESLGIAAFVISLLALIIILAHLVWLWWQRPGDTTTTSNTAGKGFPEPDMKSKGGFPQTDCDQDVYINYTSTNRAYSDLDPTNMAGDNVYSSLS